MLVVEEVVLREVTTLKGGGEDVLLVVGDDEFKTKFRSALIDWYHGNRRRMPWRGDDTSIPVTAYSVWVSEVMLQQTRVETVVNYWTKWMARFPTVQELAKASPDEVNRHWAGLGYYRRAQNLLAGAKFVVANCGGEVPRDKSTLLSVPGIGPYTAGAISSIAFALPEPVVDGNVLRVIARLFSCSLEQGSGRLERFSWAVTEQLIDRDHPADFNQAIMELGSTLCKPVNPSCGICPVKTFCKARSIVDFVANRDTESLMTDIEQLCIGRVISPSAVLIDRVNELPRDVTIYPRKVNKKKAKEVCMLVHVVSQEDDFGVTRYLFLRRPAKGLLANQWEFPSISVEPSIKGKGTKREPKEEWYENDEKDNNGNLPIDPLALWACHSDRVEEFFWQSLSAVWLGNGKEIPCKGKEEDIFTIFQSVGEIQAVSEPIVHVFSHERHSMYVVLDRVTTVELQEVNEPLATQDMRREARWMTSKEIDELGMTTGCKKVLQQIELMGSNVVKKPCVTKDESKRKPLQQRENYTVEPFVTGASIDTTADITTYAAIDTSIDRKVLVVDLSVDEDCDKSTTGESDVKTNAFTALKAAARKSNPLTQRKRTKVSHLKKDK